MIYRILFFFVTMMSTGAASGILHPGADVQEERLSAMNQNVRGQSIKICFERLIPCEHLHVLIRTVPCLPLTEIAQYCFDLPETEMLLCIENPSFVFVDKTDPENKVRLVFQVNHSRFLTLEYPLHNIPSTVFLLLDHNGHLRGKMETP